MSQVDRIKVLVVHDDPIVRVGLSATFSQHDDLEVAPDDGSSSPGDLLSAPGLRMVDVVVADYTHGVAIASRFAGAQCCRVVIVSPTDREWEIRSALANGVRGYIVTGSALAQLAPGVRAVHRGVRYLSPEVAARLAESVSVERLTSREEEVLRLVVDGLCNKVIARRLGVAVGTVKSHLKSVFDKLGVESRTQAIAAVGRRGLLCNSFAPTRDAVRPPHPATGPLPDRTLLSGERHSNFESIAVAAGG